MEHNPDIIHLAGHKHQADDAFSRTSSERVDDFDIDENLPIMAVGTRVQKQLIEVIDITSEKTQIETKIHSLRVLTSL